MLTTTGSIIVTSSNYSTTDTTTAPSYAKASDGSVAKDVSAYAQAQHQKKEGLVQALSQLKQDQRNLGYQKWPRLFGQNLVFLKWCLANVGLSTVPLAALSIEQGRAARWVTRPILYTTCFRMGRFA